MSQLVRLEGKHTWQNAHCALAPTSEPEVELRAFTQELDSCEILSFRHKFWISLLEVKISMAFGLVKIFELLTFIMKKIVSFAKNWLLIFQTLHSAVHCLKFAKRQKQYNTIQFNTVQFNTIQYNSIQYNSIQLHVKPTMCILFS